jgi:acetylornithine deacetylase/succinyl-diaminopimelate desuccinylase-like protein
MEKLLSFVSNNNEKFIEELKAFLRMPSVSSLPEHSNDMKATAEYLKNHLIEIGIKKAEVITTEKHPLVYGEWIGAPGKPTVLFYGHYDVQPPHPLELWDSPPFEPVIKDGKIWARGATDDKGQLFTHLKAIESFMKVKGSLPVNMKIILEGEEEVGSESLEKFLELNSEKLKCDVIVISDTSMYAPGEPAITYGLRGLCYMQIDVEGPKRDLHSGTYGGVVDNPINVLANIIAKLKDENGRVLIPGFYDDVLEISEEEKKELKKIKVSAKDIMDETGAPKLNPTENYSVYEAMTSRPTLDCNGIWGGFQGEGAKTIIPSKAGAKISMRLVPNQNPNKIAKLFSKYVKSIAPKTVKIEVKDLHGGFPSIVPLNNSYIKLAKSALKFAFGKDPKFIKEGGSIPVVTTLSKRLKAPCLLLGFGLDSENLHSPNEHFSLDSFNKGILTIIKYIYDLGKK